MENITFRADTGFSWVALRRHTVHCYERWESRGVGIQMLIGFAESDGKSINKATKRVLMILAEFVGSGEPLGVSELARRVNMTRNMVHRALVTLHDEGFLFKIQDTGRFVLSYNLALMQNAARPTPALKELARPYIEAISEKLGETVQLTAHSGDFQTVIDGVERPGHLVQRVKLGRAIPLHLSVGSRAILASLPDEEIQDYIARNSPLSGVTSASLTTEQALWEEVRNVRAQGHARSFGDFHPNTVGLGFAIPDIDGRPHGAVVVGGPVQRLSREWADQACDHIRPFIAELRTVASLYEAA